MEWDDKKVKICDLLIKGVLGIVITAAIAFFSIRSENNRQESARLSNKLNVLVEFITKQKELDITQGMRMFETLMGHYFQKDAAQSGPQSFKDKLVLLRLIALNFQDLPINLKPLYQQLDGQLADNKDKDDLKEVGREVARRQAYRLTAANGQDLGVMSLKAGEPVEIPSLQLKLSIDKITRDYIQVQFDFGERIVGPFQVTYFDVPLVDNTKVGALRVSLILLKSDEQAKTADVRLIAFENYLAMDRFDVKDLTLPLSLEKR
jgi:hypothetical protein